MPRPRGLRPSTLAVHAGSRIDPVTRSPQPPICRTSAFAFQDVEEMKQTFAGERSRYIYTRYDNPTLQAAEERLAALEGAGGAVSFASGMAALTASFLSVAGSGDHIVAQEDLYGGTTRLLEAVLSRMGIEVSFVASAEILDLERHLRHATRAVHVETPTNPTLRVVDLEALGKKAGEAGIALIVDNTFATPVNQRPLDLGATLCIHSATKYLAGHGDLLAGMVAGNGDAVERVRELRKETGGILDVEAAWILGRSLKTLVLRVQAQNRNALGIARLLEASGEVARVLYPGLESHPGHTIASRQMSGFGGMLSFELKGGGEAAARFVEALDLISLLPTLGGVETSVLIPAVSSHSMISREARERSGVSDGLVRLSVGIEDLDDLLEEIQGALGSAPG